MMRRFLGETKLDGFRVLSVGQHRVYDSWDQVHAYLLGTLGSSHAALFAEPRTGGGVVSWMATTEADPVSVSTLAEKDRIAALDRLRGLMDDIAADADAKAASPKMEDQRWAALLQAILTVPSTVDIADILYVADNQPVLVQWGTRDENRTAETGMLRDKIVTALDNTRRAVPPTSAPTPASVAPPASVASLPPSQHGIAGILAPLLWLLFLALLAAIYWRLLLACSVVLPGSAFGICEAPALAQAAAVGQRADLERHLDALRSQIAQAPQCRIETAMAPAQPDLAPTVTPVPSRPDPAQTPIPAPERTDLDSARERAGGKVGDVTITLLWNGHSDLDLQITCPDNQTLSSWRPLACGGEVDIDANRCNAREGAVCVRYMSTPSQRPVENAFLLRDDALPGSYRVDVRHFASASEAPDASVPFAMQIRQGEDVQTLRGAVGPDEVARMTTFTLQ